METRRLKGPGWRPEQTEPGDKGSLLAGGSGTGVGNPPAGGSRADVGSPPAGSSGSDEKSPLAGLGAGCRMAISIISIIIVASVLNSFFFIHVYDKNCDKHGGHGVSGRKHVYCHFYSCEKLKGVNLI